MKFHFGSTHVWQIGMLAALAVAVWFPALSGIASHWKHPLSAQSPIVLVLIITVLVVRRDQFAFAAVIERTASLAGLGLLTVACGLFTIGRITGVEPLVGWSILPLSAALLELSLGRLGLRAGAPALALLCLTIPLPFFVETELLQSMQSLSTQLAEFGLQMIGVPAIARGNLIRVGMESFGIAEACSGLRLQWTLATLVVCWIAWRPDPLARKLILLVLSPSVAVVANAGRIAALVTIWPWASRNGWGTFAHDALGWGLIPASLAILWIAWRMLFVLADSSVKLRNSTTLNSEATSSMVGQS